MSTIVTRSGKGAALTHTEVDTNFTNLNADLDLKAPLASPTLANPTYTGTLTGGTGVIAIGTNQIYKDANGNVGIGTSVASASAAVKLNLTNSTATYLQFSSTSTSNGTVIGCISGAMQFFSYTGAIGSESYSEKMTIDSSGKVGINVTPSGATAAKLQVTGGPTNATTLATSYSNAVVAVVPKSTSGYSLAIASGTYDCPQLQVSANGAAFGDLLIQPYGGNVGIGTSSPSGKLHVSGGRSYFAASSEPFAVGARYSAAGGTVYFGATDATATPGVQISAATGGPLLNIDSSGNVGIGTSNPTGKLDVAGTIKTLGYTVATLPTGVVGARAYVTDALAPTFGATVVTGGAVTIPVFYNGTNWIAG